MCSLSGDNIPYRGIARAKLVQTSGDQYGLSKVSEECVVGDEVRGIQRGDLM